MDQKQTNLIPTLATQEETSETYTENKSVKDPNANEEENKSLSQSFHILNIE